MKILAKNLKAGIISIQTQSLDDVWHIHRIIQPKDEVSGWTERKIKVGDSTSQKASAASIKRMHLSITVEKATYETDGKTLRLLGPVTTGNEHVSAGEYHSFSITNDTTIEIKKTHWQTYQLRVLEEAALGGRGTTLIVAYDRVAATIGSFTGKGFAKITTIEGAVQKKGADATDTQAKKAPTFYEELVIQIAAIDQRIAATTIILASSNFWREPLLKQIELQAKEMRKKVKWIECDDVSERAITQLITTKEFQQLTLGQSQAEIYNQFEEILRRIGTDGAVTYGLLEVKKATQQAAVQFALVSQALMQTMREAGTFEELETLLTQLEEQGATVHIVGEEFTICSKLDGIGGIAALLRYKVE